MATAREALATCAFVAVTCASCVGAGAAEAIGTARIVGPTMGIPWTDARRARVAADVDVILGASPTLRAAHVGVYAIETATGLPIVAHAPDQLFQPASTLKLLIGSVALERLGPAYRFRTTATLRGTTLVVAASGDPFFGRDDLRSLAAAAGIPAATDVAIDASHFDDERYPAGWTWDDFAYDYAAPLSAATIDENVVGYSVIAGDRVGAGALLGRRRVIFTPPDRCSPTSEVASVAVTGPDGATSSIDTRTRALGCTEIFGTIPLGKTDAATVAVNDPEGNFLDAVRSALEPTAAIGSVVGPAISPSLAGAEGIVWAHESPPLAEVLGPRFWIPSDNLVGELLLEELGFATGGKPGTTQKGIAFERQWLQRIGVDPATVTLADGCGMSQYDRITPHDLVAILQHDWQGPNRQLVLDSLPVGGARGTIEGIAGTPAAGRVFAKTGSMMHVRGLAGYLATVRHGAVTFAFNVDDFNGDASALATVRAAVLARIVGD